MRSGTSSLTALKVAALRALHQTAEVPPILVDPLAERILGAAGAALLAEQRRNPAETARLRTTLAVRSRIAEEAIDEAVARGLRQCIILGAGFDTFAYRHAHRDLRVLEIDHPATQSEKRDLLRAAGIDVPTSVGYVAADFSRDDLLRVLPSAGFDLKCPAVFVMLGVVPYLEMSVISRILRAVTECAEGSEIVFDYTEPYLDKPAAVRANYEAASRRVSAMGEPWITFIEPEPLHEFLRTQGFAAICDLDASALEANFLTGRSDGLVVAPLVHLVRARV